MDYRCVETNLNKSCLLFFYNKGKNSSSHTKLYLSIYTFIYLLFCVRFLDLNISCILHIIHKINEMLLD